jgi:PAS domain S-box-containing protein
MSKTKLVNKIKPLESSVEDTKLKEIKGLAKFPSENPNPVIRVFNDGNILYHNKASTSLLDFWGCQTTKILPDNYIKIVSGVLRSGLSSVTETECKDRVISLTFAPIIEEGYVNIYGMDITERKRIENELSQSKEQMRSILDNTTAVIYLKDTQGKYILINCQYQNLFHISKEEIVGKTDYDIFPKEMADAFQANDRMVLKAQVPLEMEEVALHDDGPHTYISIKFPLFDSNGIPYGVCGISTDITERKQAEKKIEELNKSLEQRVAERTEELQRSEERYRLLVEGARIIGWEYDPYEDRFTFVSGKAQAITGYTIEQWSEKGFWASHIHPEDKDFAVRYCKDATERGEDHEFEYRMITADGGFIWFKDIVQVVLDNGKVTKLRGIFVDITERKRMEGELLQSKKFLEGVFNGIQDGISVLDKDLNILKVNQTMEKWYPHALPLPGKKCFQAYHGESEPCTICPTARAIETGILQMDVVPFTGQKGRIGWMELFAFPLKDEKNNVTGVIEYIRDITERKKAEEVLQEQKETLEKKNIALNEVLGQIEIEKKQIKDNVIANAENLLLPIIEKISLKGESSKYAQLLQKNLQELTSSFGARLSDKKSKLTSREIDICNMIKNGLTSKEISGLLNISLQTIEKHRSHIRKKLGIVNEKLNLSSVLKTL